LASLLAVSFALLVITCFSSGGIERSELVSEEGKDVQAAVVDDVHAALKNPFKNKPMKNPFTRKPLPAHLDWTRYGKKEKEEDKEEEEEKEEEEHYPWGWAYKPTKFGPLRRKAWQGSLYHALALWEAADRSLETCMNADKMIFPHSTDNNCHDIDRTMRVLQQCMRHQRDGFHGLADGKNGAWSVMPELVSMTNSLSDDDREMIEKKVDSSAVLYTLARIEALHAECHGNDDTSGKTDPRDVLQKFKDPVTRVGKVFDYVRKHGGVLPEARYNPAGDWPTAMHWEGIKEDPLPPTNYDSLRRAARRGYLQPRPRPIVARWPH